MIPTITAFERSPDRGRGLARDMRVRWALEEVGQPYDVRLVSFAEMKEPAHRALHPFGQIPTYQEGALVLFESGAIILHIAERDSGLLQQPALFGGGRCTFLHHNAVKDAAKRDHGESLGLERDEENANFVPSPDHAGERLVPPKCGKLTERFSSSENIMMSQPLLVRELKATFVPSGETRGESEIEPRCVT